MSAPALETRDLCKQFGALTVASNINVRLEAGARHALIGPNGAGKTTFVNMLTGALPATSGKILFGGEDISQMAQAARTAASATQASGRSSLQACALASTSSGRKRLPPSSTA